MRRGLLLLAITLVIAGVVFGLSLRLPPVQRRLGAELAALVGPAVQGTLVDPVFVPKGQRLPLATAGYLVDSVTGIGRATIRGLEKGAEAIRR